MYDTETKNRFIELRAEGLSLDAISSQLNVPRATLGRWHHEAIEQIQRLRSLQWHLLEEQIGHRLEDSLQRIAQRIRKWEDELDRQVTVYQKPGDVIRVIRESRREYLQLRALLLAQPTRRRTACLTSLDPQERDKTRQNTDAFDTTTLLTNDLQQPEIPMSHSPVTPDVRRALISPCPLDNPPPSPDRAALAHNHNLNPDPSASPLLDTEPPINTPPLCGETPDTQPPINTPLHRGEPVQPTALTASAVYPGPHDSASNQSEISNVKFEIPLAPSITATPVTPDVRRGLTSQHTIANSGYDTVVADVEQGVSPGAANDHPIVPPPSVPESPEGQTAAPDDNGATENDRRLSPLPWGEGKGEGQTSPLPSHAPLPWAAEARSFGANDDPDHRKSKVPQSKIDLDFLGSAVISPYECAAAVVLKTLEHERADNFGIGTQGQRFGSEWRRTL